MIISEILQTNNKTGDHFALSNELLKLLEYKAKWNGRNYIKIDACAIGNSSCPHCDSFNNSQDVAKHILATGLNQIA